MSENELSVELPMRPESAKRARDALRRLCPQLEEAALGDAQLLVSELFADVLVRESDPELSPMTLNAELRGGYIHVSMLAGTAAFQLDSHPSDPGEPGWGMHLIKVLAEAWGVQRQGGSARVWFRVPVPA
jgi:hypothetical protein